MAEVAFTYDSPFILDSCSGENQLSAGEQVQLFLKPKYSLWPERIIADVFSVKNGTTKDKFKRQYVFTYDNSVLNGGPELEGCDFDETKPIECYSCCDKITDTKLVERNEDGSTTHYNFDSEEGLEVSLDTLFRQNDTGSVASGTITFTEDLDPDSGKTEVAFDTTAYDFLNYDPVPVTPEEQASALQVTLDAINGFSATLSGATVTVVSDTIGDENNVFVNTNIEGASWDSNTLTGGTDLAKINLVERIDEFTTRHFNVDGTHEDVTIPDLSDLEESVSSLEAEVFNSTLITFTPPVTDYEIQVDYEGLPAGFGYSLVDGDPVSEFIIPLGPNGESILSYNVVSPSEAGSFTETPAAIKLVTRLDSRTTRHFNLDGTFEDLITQDQNIVEIPTEDALIAAIASGETEVFMSQSLVINSDLRSVMEGWQGVIHRLRAEHKIIEGSDDAVFWFDGIFEDSAAGSIMFTKPDGVTPARSGHLAFPVANGLRLDKNADITPGTGEIDPNYASYFVKPFAKGGWDNGIHDYYMFGGAGDVSEDFDTLTMNSLINSMPPAGNTAARTSGWDLNFNGTVIFPEALTIKSPVFYPLGRFIYKSKGQKTKFTAGPNFGPDPFNPANNRFDSWPKGARMDHSATPARLAPTAKDPDGILAFTDDAYTGLNYILQPSAVYGQALNNSFDCRFENLQFRCEGNSWGVYFRTQEGSYADGLEVQNARYSLTVMDGCNITLNNPVLVYPSTVHLPARTADNFFQILWDYCYCATEVLERSRVTVINPRQNVVSRIVHHSQDFSHYRQIGGDGEDMGLLFDDTTQIRTTDGSEPYMSNFVFVGVNHSSWEWPNKAQTFNIPWIKDGYLGMATAVNRRSGVPANVRVNAPNVSVTGHAGAGSEQFLANTTNFADPRPAWRIKYAISETGVSASFNVGTNHRSSPTIASNIQTVPDVPFNIADFGDEDSAVAVDVGDFNLKGKPIGTNTRRCETPINGGLSVNIDL